jgi:hypothetical protein
MRRPRTAFITITVILAAVITSMALLVSSAPVRANPIGGITAVSAGEAQTCAVTTAGALQCWGQYGSGGASAAFPEAVSGFEGGVAAVAAGFTDTCVLRSTGAVECFGQTYGDSPRTVLSSAAFVDLGAGEACAVMTSGALQCWGDGFGFGAHAAISNGVASVSVTIEHACALLVSGGVQCWGDNSYGELGDGTTIDRLSPVGVIGITGAVAVTTADNHSCAALATGEVRCWGLRYGRTPQTVAGLTNVVDVSAAYKHTCALTSAGGVKCWGDNSYGQLGDGMRCGPSCLTPVDAAGVASGVTALSVGAYHTCAVMDSGAAKCWGNNFLGQLGSGEHVRVGNISAVPIDVVVQNVKPTPTPEPCPPEGCAPPRPPLPQTGLDFSMTIDTDGDGLPDCGTGPDDRSECLASPGSVLTVTISLNAVPPGVTSHEGLDVMFRPTPLEPTGFIDWIWPDCFYPAHLERPDHQLLLGCSAGAQVGSTYGGPMVSVEFACNVNGSLVMAHGVDRTDLLVGGVPILESNSGGEGVAITCGGLIHGDADCSVSVDSVDAAVVLQKEAALLDFLGCPQQSDVNLDNQTNAVDAVVTLQYAAGLVDTLPPQLAGR